MKLIFSYIKKHIWLFLTAVLFLTVEAVMDLLQPTYMSFIVDEGVKNADVKLIMKYGASMLVIAGIGAFSAVMRSWFASITSRIIGKEMRSDIYNHVQDLSLENIDRLKPASIITRATNDVTQIQNFINGLMRIMTKAPITCIGAIVLILIQTPYQGPVIVAIVLIVSVLIYLNIVIGYPRYSRVQQKLDRLNDVTRSFLSSVRVVKAFRAEDTEKIKFDKSSEELAEANTDALRAMAIFSPLINLTVNFGTIFLLWITKTEHASEIGRLMASVNYMTQVLTSVSHISMMINNAVRAVASSDRINEVLLEKPAQEKPSDPLRPDIKGKVAFDHVSFKYRDASGYAIEDISFCVEPGETLGIIGPTGCGKSTLIKLIPRLYDVTAGTVTVDGCDVKLIDEGLLRDKIALVQQKALLFSGTVLDNLRWGDPDVTLEEVKRACDTACATDFIMEKPEGFDTMISQGGVNVSGGQKQRLSIARALIKKPVILILDDCTSALDAETESKVLSGIREICMKNSRMTTIIISQRISTVRKADRILCMENGHIAGMGTHHDLMERCAEYKAIYDSQIGGDGNES